MVVQIKPPKFQIGVFHIYGVAPLVINKFPQKALEEMESRQRAGSQVVRMATNHLTNPTPIRENGFAVTGKRLKGSVSICSFWGIALGLIFILCYSWPTTTMKWSSGSCGSRSTEHPKITPRFSRDDANASWIALEAVFSPADINWLGLEIKHNGPLVPPCIPIGALGLIGNLFDGVMGVGSDTFHPVFLKPLNIWYANSYASSSPGLYRISTVPVGLPFNLSSNFWLRTRGNANLRTCSICFWSSNSSFVATSTFFWAFSTAIVTLPAAVSAFPDSSSAVPDFVSAAVESSTAFLALVPASPAWLPNETITIPDSTFVLMRQRRPADSAATSKKVEYFSITSLCSSVNLFLNKMGMTSPAQAMITKTSAIYSPHSQSGKEFAIDDTSNAVRIILAHQKRERRGMIVMLVALLIVLILKGYELLRGCKNKSSVP